MHPACSNKKQNHLQNSFLRRTQFWVRKTFSKPASLKRASLVALPVAISHKVSLKPKRCASATLIQKTSKNEPKHGPQKWDRQAVPFLGPHAQLSKRTKEKHFHGPIFGTVWRYQKWDRKIAKSTAKADPCNKQKITTGFNLSNQHIDLEQRRPAHAKPYFNWLSGPRNGTWKRTCGISCLRSLAPMWRFALQHHPGNIHQSFATPATPLLRAVFSFNYPM